jgi:predicted ArsR family transcriptional regulator
MEGTRDRLIGFLQEGPKSVAELAGALGITLNAVRSQISVLERDGIVMATGERRGPRRPSLIYGLTHEAERGLSRAYVPVLRAILEAMAAKGGGEEVEEVLREAGRRLAKEVGRFSGDFRTRVARALDLLTDLGGAVEAEEAQGKLIIRGHGCPLSEAVEVEPRTCKCMETFLAEITGAQVEERCERGKKASCAFLISPGGKETS